MTRVDKERNSIHAEVDAKYTVFDLDGQRFLQIDTYGKPGRIMPEKISQSIQIDKSMAKYMIELLKIEFNL